MGQHQILFGPYFMRVDELGHGYVTEDGRSSDGWSHDELLASISAEGIRDPLEVANVPANWGPPRTRVFGGNHRLVVARQLAMTHVPVRDGTDVFGFEGVDEQHPPLPRWQEEQAYRQAVPER